MKKNGQIEFKTFTEEEEYPVTGFSSNFHETHLFKILKYRQWFDGEWTDWIEINRTKI